MFIMLIRFTEYFAGHERKHEVEVMSWSTRVNLNGTYNVFCVSPNGESFVVANCSYPKKVEEKI